MSSAETHHLVPSKALPMQEALTMYASGNIDWKGPSRQSKPIDEAAGEPVVVALRTTRCTGWSAVSSVAALADRSDQPAREGCEAWGIRSPLEAAGRGHKACG
jgi:hypothetical protein